jgi:hypothetical protein
VVHLVGTQAWLLDRHIVWAVYDHVSLQCLLVLMTLAQKILANVKRAFNRRDQIVHLRNSGHCPTCDSDTTFAANDLRSHYKCLKCGSLPRERALMYVVELFYPNSADLARREQPQTVVTGAQPDV